MLWTQIAVSAVFLRQANFVDLNIACIVIDLVLRASVLLSFFFFRPYRSASKLIYGQIRRSPDEKPGLLAGCTVDSPTVHARGDSRTADMCSCPLPADGRGVALSRFHRAYAGVVFVRRLKARSIGFFPKKAIGCEQD